MPLGNMEAALVSGLLKVTGNKPVALITSKFASVMGVRKDLHELQELLNEITRWFSKFEDRAIENVPSFYWKTKLKDLAYDIEDLLDEVHLEAEKHKMDSLHVQHQYRYKSIYGKEFLNLQIISTRLDPWN